MNDEKHPLLLDHEADGIRELDNKLPRWWVWLFNLSIAFAAAYLLYYHVFAAAPLSLELYRQEMVVGDALKNKALSKFEAGMLALQPSADAAVIAQGRNTFANLCAPCHRQDGGGQVGPNLTDGYWIHGSNFVDHVKVIWNGVPEKGMLTWKGVLKPDEIYAAASFVETLKDKNVAGGKPPETQTSAAPAASQYE